MTQETPSLEGVVRERLRSLRTARGWSLDELARRTHISPSTLSRLETGRRRMALDQLVPLARALGTTVDALLADGDDDVLVSRPRRATVGDATFWRLDGEDDPDRTVARLRFPRQGRLPAPRAHPGRDWLYVLSGTLRLRLGDREVLVRAGQSAAFDTTTPHSMGGHEGPAEILSILDHRGDGAPPRRPPAREG
jgi:transcriptional regulator with XRE-family HTH domain